MRRHGAGGEGRTPLSRSGRRSSRLRLRLPGRGSRVLGQLRAGADGQVAGAAGVSLRSLRGPVGCPRGHRGPLTQDHRGGGGCREGERPPAEGLHCPGHPCHPLVIRGD